MVDWHPVVVVGVKLLYDISLYTKDDNCHELRRHQILVNAFLHQTKSLGRKRLTLKCGMLQYIIPG